MTLSWSMAIIRCSLEAVRYSRGTNSHYHHSVYSCVLSSPDPLESLLNYIGQLVPVMLASHTGNSQNSPSNEANAVSSRRKLNRDNDRSVDEDISLFKEAESQVESILTG